MRLLDNPLQVELSFKTGEVILVYGDMDEDGFYMGELDGVRGLVPSNFLTEATGPNTAAAAAGMTNNRNGGRMMGGGMGAGTGPGARGPPPPSRDAGGMGGMMGGPNQRAQPGMRKGMWPMEACCCVKSVAPPQTSFLSAFTTTLLLEIRLISF